MPLTRFAADTIEKQDFPGKAITIFPAITRENALPYSAYFASFGPSETADLPAPYAELWIVLTGALSLWSNGITITARPGEMVHVPADTPGTVTALGPTTLACVSIPAH